MSDIFLLVANYLLPRLKSNITFICLSWSLALALVWASLGQRQNTAGSETKGILQLGPLRHHAILLVPELPLQDNSISVTSQHLLTDTRSVEVACILLTPESLAYVPKLNLAGWPGRGFMAGRIQSWRQSKSLQIPRSYVLRFWVRGARADRMNLCLPEQFAVNRASLWCFQEHMI